MHAQVSRTRILQRLLHDGIGRVRRVCLLPHLQHDVHECGGLRVGQRHGSVEHCAKPCVRLSDWLPARCQEAQTLWHAPLPSFSSAAFSSSSPPGCAMVTRALQVCRQALQQRQQHPAAPLEGPQAAAPPLLQAVQLREHLPAPRSTGPAESCNCSSGLHSAAPSRALSVYAAGACWTYVCRRHKLATASHQFHTRTQARTGELLHSGHSGRPDIYEAPELPRSGP